MTEKVTTTHLERAFDTSTPEAQRLIALAQEGDELDASLTIKQALRKYKKAVFWALALSTALIMEGYDVVMVSFYLEVSKSRSTPSLVNGNSSTASGQSISVMGRNESPQHGNLVFPIPRLSVNSPVW